MNTFDLNTIDSQKPIFFIGIGGISMSALAVILNSDGFKVYGSDFKESEVTQVLRKSGIDVFIGHDEKNVGDPSLVVYTAAIKEDNPELIKARSLGVPVIERAVLVGAIMKRYKNSIAVSGTHGKTTTTSMMTEVLLAASLDPTVLVGGMLSSIGGNLRDGGRDYLVTEACEYCGSFLKFNPTLSIILNVEEDHLDYFKDINDIISCFSDFTELLPADGAVIVNFDDENAIASVKNTSKKVISFGIENKESIYRAENIKYSEEGFGSFDVLYCGQKIMDVSLSVPGEHNIKNALSIIAASEFLGISHDAIKKGLSSFHGTGRRFERKGEINGAMLIDDYAHHPTEIKATLSAAKNCGTGRVFCIFQPHTYTRSYKLKDEFSKSFKDCYEVIFADIYAAREKDTGLISSKILTDVTNAQSGNAKYLESFDAICDYILKQAKDGDVIITMGAGDIYKVGDKLLQKK